MKRKLLNAGVIALMLEGLVRFYGLFAHGVQSFDMEIMPVVALIGAFGIVMLQSIRPQKDRWSMWFSRLSILALALGINALFILGILDIAGGSSGYALWLTDLAILIGVVALIAYLFGFLTSINKPKKSTAL